MSANTNDGSSVGRRIGRLLQQYSIRIAYAEYKAKLYEEEASSASARGNAQKSVKAKVAKITWETYAKNLADKRDNLIRDVRNSLIGYSDKQASIWFAYFVENKTTHEIATSLGVVSERTVQRMIASMKDDMSIRFETRMPRIGERPSANFEARELASFLREEPSEEYIAALKDAMDKGFIDVDALEFDYEFQSHLEALKGGPR